MPKVDNAIILAAGFGSRFVPLTFELPKGLIPVRGVPMLERQIQQLQEKGIYEILIVVGYLKEKFDYLIDKYGVKLIWNPDFSKRNNLSSLYYAREFLKNSYILSADNWIENNIFNAEEDESWYSCVYKNGETSEWCVTTDDSGKISAVTIGGADSWVMYGPVFLSQSFNLVFGDKVERYYKRPGTENYMWENVFIDEIKKLSLYVNRQDSGNVYEFENLEELRLFDPSYGNETFNSSLQIIAGVFGIKENEITGIQSIKAGMTNKSFSFTAKGGTYIFRQPGEGSGELINRVQEKRVYDVIGALGISDRVVFMDDSSGEKISEYYHGAVNTNADNPVEVRDSMDIMRRVHQSGMRVDHSFSIEGEIDRYLRLCLKREAIRFTDYQETYEKIKRLLRTLQAIPVTKVLCHIDCNPDNFIRLQDNSLRLIDWEYAGMCDPIIDISMYAIYAGYTRDRSDALLETYLQRTPVTGELVRLYGYMALGGFLWALWTEYKQSFGVEFGDYGLRMYRYAKEYYSHVMTLNQLSGSST
jgi:CTP:phosphocholine cytidylyltransferase-like protein/thiamine kinase-like enzyme